MASPIPPLPQELPLDDRSNAIKVPIVTLAVFSSMFVVLRLGISLKNKKYLLLADHLLLVGHALALVGASYAYKMALVGAGKHVWDPSITPKSTAAYLEYLWYAQLLNVYGMAAVKLSICAFIFMLNFSKTFRIMIWISIVIHLTTNLVYPSIVLLGECKPIAKHWDVTLPGYCWSPTPKLVSGYMGATTNILTDLLYTSAPLVYIASVQLPKRTIWGIRAVFLFGLVTTIISALKLYEMKALNDSPDPTYTSVNLTIFSASEVFVGAFTACLPPLRKTFEKLLRKILPESTMGASRRTENSYALQGFGSQPNKKASNKGTRETHEGDDSSEYAILPEDHVLDGKLSSHAIARTTHISMVIDDKGGSSRNDDWV